MMNKKRQFENRNLRILAGAFLLLAGLSVGCGREMETAGRVAEEKSESAEISKEFTKEEDMEKQQAEEEQSENRTAEE